MSSIMKTATVLLGLLTSVGCGGPAATTTKGKQPKKLATAAARTSLLTKKTPPAGAMTTMTSSLGTSGPGKLMITSANPGTSWTDMADILGTGTPVPVTMLYDPTADVLYALGSNLSYACDDGVTMGMGDVLIIIKKDGTGALAVGAATGQCGQTSDVTYGCDFDATGASTTCGVCTLSAAGLACAGA
jgi:hypothetical protein